MAWERKMMRTVRVRNERKVGVLARLLTAIASVDASVGSMDLITETAQSVVRDVTIYADDAEHMDKVIEAIRHNEGTHILEVRDEVLSLHHKGKIAIRSRFPIDSIATLRRVYTPGVAEVCLKIADDPALARLYTSVSHMVAIVTDGTAVLGLGDIGPLAGMPVMEGKAMFMETRVGLSGVPILLNTKDPDEIVKAVAAIAPTFAAIQLEDISAPRCFEIEERLQAMLEQGFIAEVEALRTRPDLHPGLPSIRCVGYRQAWQALDAADLGNFLPTALAATRQLAKRQITWLRSIPDRTVVPADAENAPADAVSLLENAIDCVASNLL